MAARDGVSIDTILESAIAEKPLAFARMKYLAERAARGSREKLQRILDRVPHVPPDPGDEL